MYLWKLNDPRMHLRVRLHRDSSCIWTRAVLFHPAAAAVHTPHASSFQLFPSTLIHSLTPAPRSGQLWIYPSLTASYLFSSSPTFSFSPSSHLCPELWQLVLSWNQPQMTSSSPGLSSYNPSPPDRSVTESWPSSLLPPPAFSSYPHPESSPSPTLPPPLLSTQRHLLLGSSKL